ncbi:MAG: hypothetical protein Q9162_003833 [Coniocarpon cinnabarinum]
MDSDSFQTLVDTLDETADSLETALTPLLSQPLSTLATKLPLLERAKVYTLTTYAILSLLFSALKLNDVDTKSHPIFTELTRCKQYFEKIKDAETAHERKEGKDDRRLKIDKEAVARFVKAGVRTDEKTKDQGRAASTPDRKPSKRKREKVEQEKQVADAGRDQDEAMASQDQGSLSSKKDRRHGKKQKRKHKNRDTPKSTNQALQALMSKSEKGSNHREGK